MDLKALTGYCLLKPGATAEYPFGPGTLVFKVMGKMFALVADNPEPVSINLKCDPDDALALRALFKGVQPGYHMNKKHWNTVSFYEDVPLEEILGQIDDSYQLVVASLPARLRATLAAGTQPDPTQESES